MPAERFALALLLPACFAPDDSMASAEGSTGVATTTTSSDSSTMAGPSGTSTSMPTPTGSATTSSSSEESSSDAASTASTATDPSTTDDASTGGTAEGESSTGALDPCGLELEDFADDPGWIASGLPDGGNVYGWSGTTSHAGGAVGEIGGTFQRSSQLSYYGGAVDPLGASDCIAASGRIAVTRVDDDFNAGVRVGHFSVDGGTFVGFDVNENLAGVRVFVSAGGLHELAFVVTDPEVPRTWSYSYDPVAATMTLDLEDFGSLTRDLTAEEVESIADLDAFGLHNISGEPLETAPGLLELWLDDVDYTR